MSKKYELCILLADDAIDSKPRQALWLAMTGDAYRCLKVADYSGLKRRVRGSRLNLQNRWA